MWLLCILLRTLSQVLAHEISVLAHFLIRVLFSQDKEWFCFFWLNELLPKELVQYAKAPRLYSLIFIIQELFYPQQHALIRKHSEEFDGTTPNLDVW